MSASVGRARTTSGVPAASARGADPTPALRVRGVRKRYGPVAVLRGVDLDIAPDELVALVGENGVGKTTLVRCIAGDARTADAGSVEVSGYGRAADGGWGGRVEVVWQDLALCGNLDVVDNLFLGREGRWHLRSRDDRRVRARALLDELGVRLPDLAVAVDQLSGGQQQSVALARTLLSSPSVLVLDEPTAALDVAGAEAVHRLLRRMRADGVAILLISHDLDLVCQVADRVLVLRDGHVVDDVRRPRLVPDELKAAMTGLARDDAAREHLHGLRSLVDQLSDVEPSAVVPLVVSALSLAVEHDGLAVHRTVDGRLELAASLGLPDGAHRRLRRVGLDDVAAPMARAATGGRPAVAPDLRLLGWPGADDLLRAGARSAWSVPVMTGDRTLGTITGLGAAVGPVGDHVVELATLYASHAAAALERDRLLGDLTRRNATLETLRHMLETLAGPATHDAGLTIAMDALRVGLGAADVALLDLGVAPESLARLRLATGDTPDWARTVAPPSPGTSTVVEDPEGRTVLAATVPEEEHRYALLARWPRGRTPRDGAVDLLEDGVRAVRLALERRALEDARQEATALRRSHALQRTFLSRLSHELRTPLTAIHGYADTLRQPDIEWDHRSTRSFLDTIVHESGRLGGLVTDLLDASSIEAGVLRLQLDWCDVGLVVQTAVASVPVQPPTRVVIESTDVPPLRADHDRLEQVLVNLVGNAVRHTPPGTTVTVSCDVEHGSAVVTVTDDGPGLPPQVVAELFRPWAGAGGRGGSGLGLSIARGIVTAHGGSIDLVAHDGAGASFVVRLPLEGPAVGDACWAPGGEAGDPPAAPGREARP